MKRRKFLKATGAVAAGSLSLPYILPSGRLFAATGSQMAEYVVYVLFAGGVRQQESVLQRYLDDSQGVPFTGNIMYNMLEGQAPAAKIVYGTGTGGQTPIPMLLNETLQKQGTLFKEVNALSAGHYGGLNNLVQGSRATTQGLKQKPVNPTIFEYARRHGGYKATKVWFLGNGIGNSTPLLNYGIHPDYGANYGANFFAPTVTFNDKLGGKYLSNAKVYHPQDELDPMYQMKFFLDNSFENFGKGLETIGNTDEEKNEIKDFMRQMYQKGNGFVKPPVTDNSDAINIGYTCEILSYFKPNLTVVNLTNVDGCHSNFTGYLRSLHRADHAVGFLWDHIQSIPEMAGKTVLIATPECGRNLLPNAIKDQENEFLAYDHSDQNTSRVFTLMVGPDGVVDKNRVVGSETMPIGMTTDNVITIGEILGFKNDIVSAGYVDSDSRSLFDRM
ncbi:MAG TPA: hypothetical protein DCX54_05975 [Flavobacteriales bacterium]|nr:hypothetical protein [Flavobacteriales bacterium]